MKMQNTLPTKIKTEQLQQPKSMKDILSECLVNDFARIDTDMVPDRCDYTAPFDNLSYRDATRFLGDKQEFEPAETENSQQAHDNNVKYLLKELNGYKARCSQLSDENQSLRIELQSQKEQNFEDYYQLIEICKENCIQLEYNQKERSIKELIEELAEEFRRDEMRYQSLGTSDSYEQSREIILLNNKDKEIANCQNEIDELKRILRDLTDETEQEQERINNKDKELVEYEIQFCNFEEEELGLLNKIAELNALVRQNSIQEAELADFKLFSESIYKIAEILDLEPNLAVFDVVNEITQEVISMKQEILALERENVRRNDGNEAWDYSLEESSTSSTEELESLLELNELEVEEEKATCLCNEAQKTAQLIGKIRSAFKFAGKDSEVLQQIWEYLLDQ